MTKTVLNRQTKLSEHFTLGEMTKTTYHTADGNTPSPVVIANLKRLCTGWLERLRDMWNIRYGDGSDGIVINSAYRSAEVNMKAGGAKNSNHLTGCAADIRCLGPDEMLRKAVILLDYADNSDHDFDELILEKRGTTYWIHFAVRPSDQLNRRRLRFDCR